MKKSKNIILVILFTIIGFILGACSFNSVAEQEYPLKIWKENRNGQMETWTIVDDATGINYIVVGATYSQGGGGDYGGVAITPRLNYNGSLYITE